MPKPPSFTPAAASVSAAVYAKPSASSRRRSVIPLHVGDTWMEPAVGCRMQDFTVAEHPGMHRYSPVSGLPALREAIAEHHQQLSGVPTRAANVIVTPGASAGLATVIGTLVAPGESVLLAAPYWPLIAGSIRAFSAAPIAVPLMTDVTTAVEAVARFEAARTDSTVAVYWNTPHNPTGRLIPRDWLEALVDWARSHNLWILSDDVYEHYVYADEHVYTRSLAPECTVSVHSFSKSYGMAGNRCGYLVAPEDVISAVLRIMTNIHYSACTASQLAALSALGPSGWAWVQQARSKYAEMGRWAAHRLGIEPPNGSTFLFVDASKRLRAMTENGERDNALTTLIGTLAEHGVMVAPGPSFGPYPHHLRLCFTAAPPSQTRRGVELLASILDRTTQPSN
ncbi:MAG: pyridoxal phosphate-dependent aminotransferase [Pseudomonadota bacterium]